MSILVAFLSVVCGIAAACLEFKLGAPPNHFVRNSPQESAFIFDLCVTFYLATYTAGRVFYWLLRSHGRADTLGAWSKVHLVILHVGVLLYALFGSLPLLRPATLLAAAAIAIAVIEVVSDRKRRSSSRSIFLPLPQDQGARRDDF